MLAYKESDLYGRYVKEQATEAFESFCIGEDSYARIINGYTDQLYTPNYFIRIALGLLTLVAVVFSGVLLFLFTGYVSPGTYMTLFIILAIGCYVTLEVLANVKKYYNAGVDNVLIFCTILFIVIAIFANDFNAGYINVSGIIMLICAWITLRFSDAFAAMLTYCSFFVFVFLIYMKFGVIAKSTAPFIMAALSALVYTLMKKLLQKEKLFYLNWSLKAVKLLTILSFYASLNYYVVKELSNKMFDVQYSDINPLPLGWIFWFFTIIIPPVYLVYGILKRDFSFIRTGLVLIAMSIFTVRYYHPILPVEIAMLIAGLILIVISYALISSLKITRYGYTFLNPQIKKKELNLEALIIAQAFGGQHTDHSGTSGQNDLLGGGTGGGGGSGGEY